MQCSARNRRYMLKKEKELCLARLHGVSKENAQNKNENCVLQHIESEAPNSSCNISFEIPNNCNEYSKNQKLLNDLGQWQLKSRTSNKNMSALLKILLQNGIDVPLSPASLVPKIQVPSEIITVEPGHYMHFGIQKNLEKAAEILVQFKEIVCDVNIDGLPIYKSSSVQLWPILLRTVNIKNINVFAAGIYVGKRKPTNVEEYLGPFIDEISNIKRNGLTINGLEIDFKIRALICDAPAKSFACGVLHHSSANGCTKCTQVAKKINYKLVYSDKIGQLIGDEDFTERKYRNHHQLVFLNKKTPFEKIHLKMISQVPLDPMHVIDLGVTKKMLTYLVKNKLSSNISRVISYKISKLLLTLRKNITTDFNRLPRSLDELSHWKATEFRQFLLYTGVVVLKNLVDDDFYYTFLLLHCAVRLLSCPKNFYKNIETADKLLELFVHNFAVVCGPQNISYNVHSLLHICACVKDHGLLYNFSAYEFENHLQMIKKDVRKPTKILEQLYIKNMRSTIIKDAQQLGFSHKKNIIYSYSTNEYTLTITSPNNICLLKPCSPFKIIGFRVGENNNKCIIGRCFKNVRPFFEAPLNSLIALGVSIADNVLEDEEIISVDEISCKLLPLPMNNDIVFLPILHSCTN